MRLFNYETKCPRSGCGADLDPFGDQFLLCFNRASPGNSPRLNIQHTMVATLAVILRRAVRKAIVEPIIAGRAVDKPSNIQAEGSNGGTDYLDVSIHHPVTLVADLHGIIFCPMRQNSHKRKKYNQLIVDLGSGHRLIPIHI